MKYYEDFQPTGQTFEERVGASDEFDSAMGRIALGFAFLEDTARNMIVMLAGTDFSVGYILTTELSFRQKLNVLASLIKQQLPALVTEENRVVIEDQTNELLKLCWRSEDLRNTYFHSSYARQERAKMTAKSKYGLRIHVEPVDSSLLLDVADFIVYCGMELEILPMILGLADSTTSGVNYVSYSLNGAVIKTFRFGEHKSALAMRSDSLRCVTDVTLRKSGSDSGGSRHSVSLRPSCRSLSPDRLSLANRGP